MAYFRNLNKSCDGGNGTVWWLFRTLLDAGWIHRRSGSGTGGLLSETLTPVFRLVHNPPISPAYAQYGATSVGNGIGNDTLGAPSCWFVLRAPSGTREVCFIRSSGLALSGDARWVYGISPGGLYTGGSAASAATATDEIVHVNARGGATSVFASGAVANLVHCMANSTSINGEYQWVVLELVNPITFRSCTWLDPLDAVAPASTNHVVSGQMYTTVGTMAPTYLSRTTGGLTAKMRASDGSTQNASYNVPTSNAVLWDALGDQDESLHDRPLQMPVCLTVIDGYKGIGTTFFCGSAPRTYPATCEAMTHLYINNTIIANMWDGATTPGSV